MKVLPKKMSLDDSIMNIILAIMFVLLRVFHKIFSVSLVTILEYYIDDTTIRQGGMF